MEPRFVTKEAFKVIGMDTKFSMKNNVIPQLWQKFMTRMGEIKRSLNPGTALGICETACEKNYKDFTEETEFTEIACLEVEDFEFVPEGMVTRTIDTHEYAVFTHRGELSKLNHTYDYIYKQWLPDSGYRVGANFDFELYDHRFNPMDQKNSEIDIYFPVKKASE